MRNLLKRSISGLIYAFLFIGAIIYSKETYITLLSVFGILCMWEFFKLLAFKNRILYFFSLNVILLLFLFSFKDEIVLIIFLILALSGSIQLLFNLFLKKKNYPSNNFQKINISARYILLSFLFLVLLPFINGEYQKSIILWIVIFIWINDSFAFIVGKNLGKRKLFKSVSPKKTIEGFIGGIFFTLISAIIISYYTHFFSMIQWVVIALIVSILGSLGDLVESKFKRQANIKDSGTIMPGHGGMLDRLDSLLFVAPFVYLYIHYLI